jgi:hypothetical protein
MDIDRRELLRRMWYGIAAVPLLNACGSDPGAATTVDSPTASGDIDAPKGKRLGERRHAVVTDKARIDPFIDPLTSCLLVAA